MTKHTKSHRTRSSSKLLKDIRRGTKKAIPVVAAGLKTVGTTAKVVAEKSAPVLEEGVSTVYGALATGFDMGIKGANTVAKGVSKITKKRHVKHNKKNSKKKHRSNHKSSKNRKH